MDPAVLPKGLSERPSKAFGINLLCDPYVYVHQSGYWCGVFYEEELENYMLREIQLGDTVIDVGMNVGHVTLPAATLVGDRGIVISFEPNIDLVQRVQLLADKQKMNNIEIFPFGLGSVNGSFDLVLDPNHSGGATFRNNEIEKSQSMSITCSVKVGDEVLINRQFPGRVFLKMDVEGFELEALEGLSKTLNQVDHAIIEVSPLWLGVDGTIQLFEIMKNHGFCPHHICNDGTVGKTLAPDELSDQVNVLFKRVT